MFYRWWNRCQTAGTPSLEEKPKGHPRSSFVDDPVKIKIVNLRKRYGWGPNKIAGHLNHKGFCIDHNKVYHVICDADLNRPITEPRKTCGTSVSKENIATVFGRRILSFAAMITGWSATRTTIHASPLARLRFGVQPEETPYCCLSRPLSGMAFQNRYLPIREHGLSLQEAEPQSLRSTVASWELSISLPACAGLQPQER